MISLTLVSKVSSSPLFSLDRPRRVGQHHPGNRMQSLLLPFAGIAPVVIVGGGDKLDVEDAFDGSDAHAHARLLTSTTVAASFFHPAASVRCAPETDIGDNCEPTMCFNACWTC